jgi:hypothetical protein
MHAPRYRYVLLPALASTTRLRAAYLVLGLLFACPQSVLGAPTVFFGRDDNTSSMTSYPNSLATYNQFTASLSSFGVATVENAATGVPNPTLTFDGSTITAATQGVLPVQAAGFQIGTQALLELDAAIPGQFDTMFTFDQYVTGFGLYVIQGGDSQNNNPTTFRLSDTATNAFVDVPVQIGPGWGNDNAFFLGIDNTFPFNQVTILEAIDVNDGMLYDNIVAGNVVPEPSSAALLAIGLVACIARWRVRPITS